MLGAEAIVTKTSCLCQRKSWRRSQLRTWVSRGFTYDAAGRKS